MMELRVLLDRPERMVRTEMTVPKAHKENQEKMVLKEAMDRTDQMVLREIRVLMVNRALKVQLVSPATMETPDQMEIKDHKETKGHTGTQESRVQKEIQETMVPRVNLEDRETQVSLDLMVSREDPVWTPLKRLVLGMRVQLEDLENLEIQDHKARKELLILMEKRETRDQ